MTAPELKSNFKLTTYLALTGKPWGVYYKDFVWLCEYFAWIIIQGFSGFRVPFCTICTVFALILIVKILMAVNGAILKHFCLFSCDQAALRTVPSVFPSVCHTFFTMFLSPYHHEIFSSHYNRSDVQAKGQGQRPKVKIAEVKTQFSRFWTVTPVWIHICQWNDRQSLMWQRRDALLFFKVICQISRSHGTKTRWILADLGISGLYESAMKLFTKLEEA